MKTTYQHSKVFASMKGVKETIHGNLTTSQYLQILDELIERAVIPVLFSTNYFDSAVARLLGWQEKNFRRKISLLERSKVPPLVLTFLLQNKNDNKLRAFRDMKLDRGVIFMMLKIFLESVREYVGACECKSVHPLTGKVDLSYCLHVKQQIEASLGSSNTLLAAINESMFWLEKALSFKQSIMEKYIRLTLKTAQKDYVTYFNMSIKLDDMIQIYLLAASRAIDKCDSGQGALTSHIQNWFLTARSRAAESIQSKTIDIDIDIDAVDFQSEEFRSSQGIDSSVEEVIVNAERRDLVSRLARLADPTGAARLFLGIEEHLNDEERKLVGATASSMSDNFTWAS